MRIRIRQRRRRRPLPGSPPVSVTAGGVRRQVREILGQPLQTALQVGAPDDAREREADRLADRVVDSTAPLPLHAGREAGEVPPSAGETLRRQTDAASPEEQERPPDAQAQDQTQQESAEPQEAQSASAEAGEAGKEQEEDTVQAKGGTGGPVALPVARAIHAQRGRGQRLPPATRAFFEARFGASFAGVRIHADSSAARLAEVLGARAFTLGRDVFFNRGEYAPATPGGRHLLAHELAHVLQQRRGDRHLRMRVIPGRVSCFHYPSRWPIFRVIGLADGRAVVAALQQAVDRAVFLINDAVAELEGTRARIRAGAPPAWPVVSAAVSRGLRRRLRLDPGRRGVWTGTGPGTVEIVLRWYRNIARILAGDWMRYNCLGPDCEAGDDAWTYGGEYRIRLCAGFWRGGLDYRAITLIHEASHVYYDTEDSGRGPGSAYCLESFLCDYHGLNVCRGC